MEIKYDYYFQPDIFREILNLKYSSENDIFYLFRRFYNNNKQKINIFYNEKLKRSDEIIRLFEDPPKLNTEDKVKGCFLPKNFFEKDNLFKIYFIKQPHSFINNIESKTGFIIFNFERFINLFEKFVEPEVIEYFGEKRDNIFNWNNYKDILLCNEAIIYDPYLLKDEETIKNNVIVLLNSEIFSSNSEILLISTLFDSKAISDAQRIYNIIIDNLQDKKRGSMKISVLLIKNKIINDRFMITNNFRINMNHTLQSLSQDGRLKNNSEIEMNLESNIRINPERMLNHLNEIKRQISDLKKMKDNTNSGLNSDYIGDYYSANGEIKSKFFELQ